MELTNAEWKEIVNAGVDTIYRWPRVRQAINDVLSRRTAEPQPAETSNELIQLRELMRQLVDMDRSMDLATGEDTTLERVRYLCQTLVPDSIYPPPSICGVCGKELVFTVGPHNEGDTLITSDCRHSFIRNL